MDIASYMINIPLAKYSFYRVIKSLNNTPAFKGGFSNDTIYLGWHEITKRLKIPFQAEGSFTLFPMEKNYLHP